MHFLWIGQQVAPLAGAWIEISEATILTLQPSVAPLAGAWIEIALVHLYSENVKMSLPSRERGLKYLRRHSIIILLVSLPSRERGLK